MPTDEYGSWGYGSRRSTRTVTLRPRNTVPMECGKFTRTITFVGPPCRTLDDMSPEEIAAIEAQYGAPALRRDGR